MADDRCHTHKSRPADEQNIMFRLAGGDMYQMPAAQVQQICPELETTVDEAIEKRTAKKKVFEVPRELEGLWKSWWTVNDYVVRGKGKAAYQDNTYNAGGELNSYEQISSFMTDAIVYILATRCNHHAGAEAAVAATQDRAADILECFTDAEFTFDQHVALFDLESLIAAARLACSDWSIHAPQKSTRRNTESAGGRRERTGRAGLRVMVSAACVTLGPLLAELPALRAAAFEDAKFAALWEGVSDGGLAPDWFTPMVRDRLQRVVEGRDVVDSVWSTS